jgi:two-component sensor histidine kinase
VRLNRKGKHLQEKRESGTLSVTPLEAFNAAIDAGVIGVWSWHIPTGLMTWSTDLGSSNEKPDKLDSSPDSGLSGSFLLRAEDLFPQEQPGVLMAIKECLRTARPCLLDYRLATAQDDNERWFEVAATVVVEAGNPVQVLGVSRDVTRRLHVSRELRVRSRQQEALALLGEGALIDSNLQKFFEQAVATVSDILDVEFVKILELVPGDAEMLLRSGLGWPAELVGAAHVSTGRETHAGYTLAAGRPVILEDLATEVRFPGTQLLRDQQIISGVATPIAGRDGRAYGVLCAHTKKRHKFYDYDISFLSAVANVVAGAIQRRQLDQRQELMIRELRHRSGNLFAQLLALFSQTARSSQSLSDLVGTYEGRVLALANVHRLITEGGWKAISVVEFFDILLAPYRDRIVCRGPSVLIEPDPSLGLGLVMHELVTNAGEHGSLSIPTGRVDLGWTVTRTHQGHVLVLDWKETGGPEPKKQRRNGFGTRLISMVIERQLNGQVQQTFDPKGLQTRLVVPLTQGRSPGELVRATPDSGVSGKTIAFQ